MIYQHPLAYLLGIEGLALLHALGGEYDEEFTQRRLAEVRALLANPALIGHEGVLVGPGDTLTGYRQWAATYDEPRNSLFDVDEPVMRRCIEALPVGDALDAACATGRHAEYLAGQGFTVIGVDSSPEMLERARNRVPSPPIGASPAAARDVRVQRHGECGPGEVWHRPGPLRGRRAGRHPAGL